MSCPREDNSELPIVFHPFTGKRDHPRLVLVYTRRAFCRCLTSFLASRQVIIVLTQLEGSGGFSIAHRLTHRLANSGNLHDWGPPDTQHCPQIDTQVEGLHSPRLITWNWERGTGEYVIAIIRLREAPDTARGGSAVDRRSETILAHGAFEKLTEGKTKAKLERFQSTVRRSGDIRILFVLSSW